MQDESLNLILSDFKDLIRNKYNSIISDEDGNKKVLIGVPAENEIFNAVCRANSILPDEQIGEEGYLLYIGKDSILVSANGQKGLFYGVQTLIQLIKGSGNLNYLQGIRIKDYPSFKYRAVMDDISRGPVPTLDFMKYQIRRFSSMKINMFMHYVEHVVKTKSHPEFAPADGSLTIDEWKELAAYAEKYHVTLAGSFQSFGHFNNILSVPKYSSLGESGTLISPVNPDSYKFLKDIYTEMVPAFKAPFFNINCDETFDLGKAASKKMVDSLGYAGVFENHILKLYGILKQLGMQTMMWGDIPLLYPRLLKSLPKDIIMGIWNYDNIDSFEKDIKPFAENGYQFFVCPGVLNSNRIFPDYIQTTGNIKNLSRDGAFFNAAGIINAVWDDGGTALFGNDWYGVSYGADKSWNADADDVKNFDLRYNRAVYGSDGRYLTDGIRKLIELSSLESTDGMNDKILFEKLLPDSGKSSRISLNEWDKVAQIACEADSLLKLSNLDYNETDKDYIKFTASLYKTLEYERSALIDAAGKYKTAFNEAEIDKSAAVNYLSQAAESVKKIIQNIETVKNEFESLWKRENQPYSLNKIEEKYSGKIRDYKEIEENLKKASRRIYDGETLISPEKIRLAISKLPGKYFREWLVVNPIEINSNENISSADYLESAGGEKNTAPKVTEEFIYKGNKYRWSRITSALQDEVNLAAELKNDEGPKATYLFATIESSEEKNVTASFGCAGNAKIFINGNSVFEKENNNEFKPDEFGFPIHLKSGINNLMIKIMKWNSGWALSFRIPENNVRNRKNRYKLIEE